MSTNVRVLVAQTTCICTYATWTSSKDYTVMMAAKLQDLNTAPFSQGIDLPGEIISNILLLSSTPTFLQLSRCSKQFRDIASNSREVLLYHIGELPGDKTFLQDFSNEKLFLLLRQRAANNLYGANFTANMTEYIIRNAKIDPWASSISGLDADYVRMALVFKDNIDIRQYTSHCAIKEKIKQTPGTKIIKLVQWSRFISALCAWPKARQHDFADDFDSGTSESETEVFVKAPFLPSADARLAHSQPASKESKVAYKKPRKSHESRYEYRVVHFDIYTIEDSQSFTVEGYKDYVPRDFANYTSLHCAILWDRNTPSGRPTEDAVVVCYSASEAQHLYATKYESKIVWPKTGKPERSENESDEDETPKLLPGRIAFFKEGRRIKLYDAGGVVPYQILSTATTQHESYASTNVIDYAGFSFQVETPFFGTHAKYRDDLAQQEYCFQTHLCLGLTTVDVGDGDGENEIRVLCILRSQTRYYPDSCDHKVSLQRMTHVSAGNSTIVARLWGWEEMHTNLTGTEIVSISPGGTRIAIAMWNKVLVYPLNPKILCEEVPSDFSDDDSPKAKRKKKRSKQPWEAAPTDYYKRKREKSLFGWKIVELRPMVLDLNGAVAHKMNWSTAKGKITDTIELIEKTQLDMVAENSEDASVHMETGETGSNETSAELPVVTHNNDASNAITVPIPPTQPFQSETSPINQTEVIESIALVESQEPSMSNPDGVYGAAKSVTVPEVAPVSVSPSIPTSPVSTVQNSESTIPVPPTDHLHSSLPLSPLSTISLNVPSIPSPFHLSTAPNTVQPHKLSARKKEKAPDLPNVEQPPLNSIEKPQLSYTTSTNADNKANVDQLSPFTPVLNKHTLKPQQQTVAEALSTNGSPLSPPVDMNTSSVQLEENSRSLPITPQSETNTELPGLPAVLCPTIADSKSGGDTEKEKPEELSKVSTGASKATEESETEVKRRKRIMEEELIILTDRGIQIWNLGPRAKGKRKKLILPLEESLKGRLPSLQGGKRATMVVPQSCGSDTD